MQFGEDINDHGLMPKILNNILHNKKIFSFLMTQENNQMFNFKENVTNIMNENYHSYNPDIKMQSIDILSILFDFSLPSIIQDNYLKDFLAEFYKYHNSKTSNSENENQSFFISEIYKDFKSHDYEEYEVHFLNLTHSNFAILTNNFRPCFL